jgi:hypothetical protein
MKVTIEIATLSEMERLLATFKKFDLESFKVNFSDSKKTAPIAKGDKHLDPTALFGIWSDNPRTLEQIREKSWKRNWKI